MPKKDHSKIKPKDVHIIQSYEYVDETERLAATEFEIDDIGKVARQLDNDTFWILANLDPILWKDITNTSSSSEPSDELQLGNTADAAFWGDKGQEAYDLMHAPGSDDQDLSGLQETLISGVNLKTINGQSLLGTGDLLITNDGGGGSGTLNGFEKLNISSNYTVLPTDGHSLEVIPTVAGLSISLPDATTLDTGLVYVVANNGDFSFYVKNNENTPKRSLASQTLYLVFLRDNSTPAGEWLFEGWDTLAPGMILDFAPFSYNDGNAAYYPKISHIENAKYIITYYGVVDGSASLALRVIDFSTDVPTLGPITTYADTGIKRCDTFMSSPTEGVTVWYSSTGTHGCVTTIDGMDITGHVIATAGPEYGMYTYGGFAPTSNTSGIASCNYSSGLRKIYSYMWSVVDTTLSWGIVSITEHDECDFVGVAKLNTGNVIINWVNDDDGNRLYTARLEASEQYSKPLKKNELKYDYSSCFNNNLINLHENHTLSLWKGDGVSLACILYYNDVSDAIQKGPDLNFDPIDITSATGALYKEDEIILIYTVTGGTTYCARLGYDRINKTLNTISKTNFDASMGSITIYDLKIVNGKILFAYQTVGDIDVIKEIVIEN